MTQNVISTMTWREKIRINKMLRTRLLHFLVEETFTTILNISLLLERNYSQAYRLCKKMEDEGLLKMHHIVENTSRHLTVCGITPKGVDTLRGVFFLREDPIKTFVPSKVGSMERLIHKLKIQRFRAIYTVNQINLGQIPPFMTYVQTEKKPQPDFLIHVSAGKKNVFSVELECTQKSKQRYLNILEDYSKVDQHLLYLFDTEEDLLKIGRVISKLIPKTWKHDNFFLLSTIDKVLMPKSEHWEWGDGCYYIHNFLSTVIAISHKDLKDGNLVWKNYDFAPNPFYSDSIWANRFPELCGRLDTKGRIIPNITNHP